jgi:hypothetical protein
MSSECPATVRNRILRRNVSADAIKSARQKTIEAKSFESRSLQKSLKKKSLPWNSTELMDNRSLDIFAMKLEAGAGTE